MDRVDIEGKIRIVLQEKFDVPSERLKIENYGEPLTGSIFEFTGVKLLYLFFEIEKNFKIKFKEQDVINYHFLTINGIINTIFNIKN